MGDDIRKTVSISGAMSFVEVCHLQFPLEVGDGAQALDQRTRPPTPARIRRRGSRTLPRSRSGTVASTSSRSSRRSLDLNERLLVRGMPNDAHDDRGRTWPAARSMMSRWPYVTGRSVPGQSAVRPVGGRRRRCQGRIARRSGSSRRRSGAAGRRARSSASSRPCALSIAISAPGASTAGRELAKRRSIARGGLIGRVQQHEVVAPAPSRLESRSTR